MTKRTKLVLDFVLLGILCAATWGVWKAKDLLREPGRPGPVTDSGVVESETTDADFTVVRAEQQAEERIARYRADLEHAEKEHLRRLGVIHRRFVNGLRNRGPRRFDAVRAKIPDIVESITSFSEMSGMVKDVALDAVKDENRVEMRCERLLDVPLMQPRMQANESLIDDFEIHAEAMREESRRYADEARVLLEETETDLRGILEADIPLEKFSRDMQSIHAAMKKQAKGAGWTSMGVVFEAATLRATIASFKKVLSWGIKRIAAFMAKQCAKTAAKATVGTILPPADGPLPVGDVIAVGCFIWTAADVWELCHVLPRDLEKSIAETVDDLQQKTIDSLAENAEQLHRAHIDFAHQIRTMALGE